jgi:hypothetical protein
MILRKRSRLIGIKLPDSDTIGLKFIKHLVKSMSNKKLYATLDKVRTYSDSKEKTEILSYIKAEFDKRKLEGFE